MLLISAHGVKTVIFHFVLLVTGVYCYISLLRANACLLAQSKGWYLTRWPISILKPRADHQQIISFMSMVEKYRCFSFSWVNVIVPCSMLEQLFYYLGHQILVCTTLKNRERFPNSQTRADESEDLTYRVC
jgi:hypothetical protein